MQKYHLKAAFWLLFLSINSEKSGSKACVLKGRKDSPTKLIAILTVGSIAISANNVTDYKSKKASLFSWLGYISTR
ncbi:hypothetical protein CKQ84_10460 [Shewanella sp. WE21]|uniref:hypothetical protein n=1 Tax=Shewanella sp. WE21 TaxID=2029986 RepID=UPI000CF60B0F|nr:hypothetical protein [Shewanella sp. WE21]AVI66255.1 hypothetical protein CKQ84_10460 [Shewanella sp. WE21]